MTCPIRMPLALVSVFWVYVTGVDLLQTTSTQAALSAMRVQTVFAPWGPQLLEHLLLYPILLGCLWGSQRLGWRPYARRVPGQLALGLGFSALAAPSLLLGELCTGDVAAAPHVAVASLWRAAELEAALWLSSVTRFLLAYAFALALLWACHMGRALRERETQAESLRRALSVARLATLRTQLSPHSLLNLLHTLQGQIGWDPPAARELVAKLGEVLRELLSASEREFWPLEAEIRFAQQYLALQQHRFAERLRLNVPAAAGLPGVWVPSLILQPLVENAVVHGLRGHRGAVSIRVEVAAAGDELTLRVVNTVAPRDVIRTEGIGLRNVRHRLALHFGERARMQAAAQQQGEWMVEIHLPLLGAQCGAPSL
ncbi:MAG: sensor histidine kinase [Steroidobacteraceae bacterium]